MEFASKGYFSVTPVIDTLYIMVFPIQEKERANDAYE